MVIIQKKEQFVYSIEFYENKNVATSVTVPANSKFSVNLDVAADNSISEKSQKNNTFDENNSKNISDERKSVKRSYEVDSTGEESELKKDTTLFLWLATEYKRSQYCKN